MSIRAALLALLALLPLLAALTACAHPSPSPSSPTAGVPGADRDAHGCIGSAGYRWCQRTQQCERPWELAKAKGLENTAEDITAYCAAPPAGPAQR